MLRVTVGGSSYVVRDAADGNAALRCTSERAADR